MRALLSKTWAKLCMVKTPWLEPSEKLPPWFDSSRLDLATETHDGMLSIDNKNYVIYDAEKRDLTKHGSGLKGRHLPVICDRFIDELCWALFEGQDPFLVYQRFVDLSAYPNSEFYFNVNLGKRHYKKGTMYAKIAKLADVNASLFILKTAKGYDLEGSPDFDYYKKRLGDIAERITKMKAKEVRQFLQGQTKIDGPFKLGDFMRSD